MERIKARSGTIGRLMVTHIGMAVFGTVLYLWTWQLGRGPALVGGIFAALFLQTVINLGMNLQVLPVIGVTLPFFSAGGSSVVMMYFCVGLVLSVGLQARRSRVDAVAIL